MAMDSMSQTRRPALPEWVGSHFYVEFELTIDLVCRLGIPVECHVHGTNRCEHNQSYSEYVALLHSKSLSLLDSLFHLGTQQPGTQIYTADLIAAGVASSSVPIVNGTMFVMLVDTDLFVTPYNMSLLNDHVVAGPAVYQSG